jgi:hypothetical protein
MRTIFLLALLIPNLIWAQLSTINPDTVCYQSNGSIYEVVPTAGLIYTWTITPPGIITGGQGTNQIQVDWSNANPGLIAGAVQVQASTNNGCLSPIQTLDVFVYNVVFNLTPIADLCEYSNCVPLQATPVGGTWSGVGVVNSDFCPTTSGDGTFMVMYEYSDGGCFFTDVMQVTVVPQPILLPIQHN